MNTINYDFLENELLESMLSHLQNVDEKKDIICEQLSILAIFGVINAEQLRQLSCFKYYDDFKCYATYLYSGKENDPDADIIDARCEVFADALIQLEQQENFIARTTFSEADFKASSPKNCDRSDDQSIILVLSDQLLYAIDGYFISKEFIDGNCIISRKKAINTVRRKLLNQILQIDQPTISNRAYRCGLRKFEYHFTQNGNIVDNIKLFLYRSLETSIYQSLLDTISSDGIEDTEFNRAKFQETVKILAALQRINTNQIIQLCAHSLNKPGSLPISILSLQAAMDISLNIELEISTMDDQECNDEFSLDDFEDVAQQKIDEPYDLDFYDFIFGILEMSFYQMLEFKRTHKKTLNDADHQRLLTLLLVRKISSKDYVSLKLEFDF